MEEINYSAMEEAYQRACAGEAEPDLVVLRPIRKTKAVRRKVGRLLRRGQVQRGQVLWPFCVGNNFGAVIP